MLLLDGVLDLDAPAALMDMCAVPGSAACTYATGRNRAVASKHSNIAAAGAGRY